MNLKFQISVFLFLGSLVLHAQTMEEMFQEEVNHAYINAGPAVDDRDFSEEFAALPQIVQQYIQRSWTNNLREIRNFEIAFVGEIRSVKGRGWGNFVLQENVFIKPDLRVLYVESGKVGVASKGVLTYDRGRVTYLGRAAKILDLPRDEVRLLEISGAVSYVSEVCLYAPMSLLKMDVRWEKLNDTRVKLRYSGGKVPVVLFLQFDESGKLLTIKSEDYFNSSRNVDRERQPWTITVQDYKVFEKAYLPSRVTISFDTAKRPYEYIRFDVASVKYNISRQTGD